MTTCKRCVLTSDYPGLEFDAGGVCRLCNEPSRTFRGIPPAALDECRKDFEKTIEEVKGKHAYDGLLCLSGGKDSAYLAHELKERYGLRLLLFNVVSGFGNDMAASNVAELVKKLDMPLATFKWPEGFGPIFFRYFFLHPLRQGLTATVCRACQTLLQSVAVQRAKKEGIPLVFHGFSPFQIAEKWFYEISRETLLGQYAAFGDFWDESRLPPNVRDDFCLSTEPDDPEWPRFLLPLHVMDCPTEQGIRRRLQELDLLPIGRTAARKTNCVHSWLMAYLDTVHFGEPPFRDWISEKIRQGEGNRATFLLEMKGFSWLCRHHLFRPFFVRSTLRRLGLTEQEVLRAIQEANEDESKFNDIYKINPSRDRLEAMKDRLP